MFDFLLSEILNIAALFVLLILIINSSTNFVKMQKYYLIAIVCLITVLISEIGFTHFESLSARYRPLTILFYMINYGLSPFILVFMAKAICPNKNQRLYLLTIPSCLNIILVLLSAKYNLIFYVTADNTHQRGILYFVFIMSFIFNLVFLFTSTTTIIHYYQCRNKISLIMIFSFIVFGTGLQLFYPHSHSAWHCITIAVITYYAYYNEVSQKIDVVTELFNRYACESYIEKLKKGKKASIIFFDVNDFKTVNDTCGHQYGDYCLKQISMVLKHSFSNVGFCYRYGGDELCVISCITNKMTINKAIMKFIQGIDNLRESNKKIPTVAIGHAFYNKDTNTIEEAIREADSNMYAYKKDNK